ncbi:MAG TPA: hypothetical protein VJV74_09735, partial [Terriglobia bacterium]|nr:hypothetical protein [Terriglobia bacterium]
QRAAHFREPLRNPQHIQPPMPPKSDNPVKRVRHVARPAKPGRLFDPGQNSRRRCTVLANPARQLRRNAN